MLWTLAESANCPRDFDMMVVSMEILMAAELLSLPGAQVFWITPTLGIDVLFFLLKAARQKPQVPQPPPRSKHLAVVDSDEEQPASGRIPSEDTKMSPPLGEEPVQIRTFTV
jgi:hypothetical protein